MSGSKTVTKVKAWNAPGYAILTMKSDTDSQTTSSTNPGGFSFFSAFSYLCVIGELLVSAVLENDFDERQDIVF